LTSSTEVRLGSAVAEAINRKAIQRLTLDIVYREFDTAGYAPRLAPSSESSQSTVYLPTHEQMMHFLRTLKRQCPTLRQFLCQIGGQMPSSQISSIHVVMRFEYSQQGEPSFVNGEEEQQSRGLGRDVADISEEQTVYKYFAANAAALDEANRIAREERAV
jgi:hypothetical protein